MDLKLNEQQEMLKKMARDFLVDRCPSKYVREMENDAQGYSTQLWQEMAQLGWMGLVLPEEYGGGGMGFIDLMLLVEETGRACLPGPFFPTVICALLILSAGNDAQRQNLLPKIVAGSLVPTLALSEPGVDYSKEFIGMTATAKGGNYTLNGIKLFVPYAHVADYLICVAKASDSRAKASRLAILLVAADSPGITRTPLKTMAADKQYEVALSNVSVPEANVLGKRGETGAEVDRILQLAAVAKCAEMVGGAQKVFEMTLDYAKERIQFGRPIATFQVIQHYLVQMLINVNKSRLITYQAACTVEQGTPGAREIAQAKAWVSEAYRGICSMAHQIHGGIGFSADHDLQLYTRRARAAELAFGDADFHREKVAAQIGL